MNAIPADDEGWVAPGLWAGIRAVRGGAGTALVGSYAAGRAHARRVPRRGGRPGDRLGLPPPRGGRARRHRGLAARHRRRRRGRAAPRARAAGAPTWCAHRRRAPRRGPTSSPSASARPLYVFEGARIEDEARAFQEAAGPDVTVAYSLKSNTLMGLVARLHRAGLLGRGGLGLRVPHSRAGPGCPGSRIVFNGPLKTSDELRRALRRGRHGDRRRRRAGPRDRPSGALRRARGPRRPAPRAARPRRARPLRRARPPGARRRRDARRAPACRSPACTSTSAPTSSARCRRAARRSTASPWSTRCRSRASPRPPRCCARSPTASAASSGSTWAAAGRPPPASAGHLDAAREALGPGHPPLILEPGRALIRDAGWLLTRVVARRGPGQGGGGRRHHPGPVRPVEALAGARRSSRARAPSGRPTSTARSACSTTPSRARCRCRRSRVGDLVWIGQTGAYAMAQASPFIHLRPGAVLVEGGRADAAARARDRRRGPRRAGRAAAGGPRGPRGVALVIAVRVRAGPVGRQREDDGRRPRRRGASTGWSAPSASWARRPTARRPAASGSRRPGDRRRRARRPGDRRPGRRPPTPALAAAEEVLDRVPAGGGAGAGGRAAAAQPGRRRRPTSPSSRCPASTRRSRPTRRSAPGWTCCSSATGCTIADEVALKRRAHDLGLLVMGPGAGTAIIDGLALGFANVVAPRRGRRGGRGRHGRAGGDRAGRPRGRRREPLLRHRRPRPQGRRRRDHRARRDRPPRRRRRHRRDPLRLQAPLARGRRARAARAGRPAAPRRSPAWSAAAWSPVEGVHLAATLEEAALAAARLAGQPIDAAARRRRAGLGDGGVRARALLGRHALQRGGGDPRRAARRRCTPTPRPGGARRLEGDADAATRASTSARRSSPAGGRTR